MTLSTECPKGHSDWRFSAKGKRSCAECHRNHWRAYNARKQNALGHHTKAEKRAKLSLNPNCPDCGVALSTVKVHWDHIIALVNGGSDDIDNLRPTCVPCNLSKGSKDLLKWGIGHVLGREPGGLDV